MDTELRQQLLDAAKHLANESGTLAATFDVLPFSESTFREFVNLQTSSTTALANILVAVLEALPLPSAPDKESQ